MNGCVKMDYRLPYYMAYPMPLLYDDEKNERRDWEYLKSLYPTLARKISPYVEEECERMEFQGSMIYDEYPDQLQIRMMCKRIYKKVMEEILEEEKETDKLMEIIQIMLFHELYQRRCKQRRCGRKYY